MSESPPPLADRELLAAWRCGRDAEWLRVWVQRYAAFVRSSALRRTGSEALADQITRAVFLTFVRRAHKLPRKVVLAEWLFNITRLATRKAEGSRLWPWRWFRKRARVPGDAPWWLRVSSRFDKEMDRLPRRRRVAFLLVNVLGASLPEAAGMLRVSERRVAGRAHRAARVLSRRLRKRGGADVNTLTREVAEQGCAAVSPEWIADLEALLAEAMARRPRQRLARRVLRSLAWKRWRWRVVWTAACVVLVLIGAGTTAWFIDEQTGHSQLIAWFIEWNVRHEAKTVPGLAVAAKPWPTNGAGLSASAVRGAADIYQPTNIWPVHLKFSQEDWKAAQPKRIGAMSHFVKGDGTVHLRNAAARRSGIAGVLGFDFNWSRADFEFGGVLFTNVGARMKGNGTFLGSLYGEKRAFKVDLNKRVQGQKLVGLDELTFNNLVVDQSFLSDALGYEFFREAGVPAPRTAYAYLSLSVAGVDERKPLGVYALVESVDGAFAKEWFGSKKTPIFKPVTYELFSFLGDKWSDYAAIYDLKTEATAAERQRVIDLARLVSGAGDAEFSERIGEFLDLDGFAKFLAAQVLLANYDGILANGQNFYLYLDRRTDRFGFIPWDLDLAWGAFFLLGTPEERERASIWHPWVGENRFIERVMKVEAFRTLYRRELEWQLKTLFTREELFARIDQLAEAIRPVVSAESEFRLKRFNEAIDDRWPRNLPRGGTKGADRPIHYLKRFIEMRARFVREQLDGKSHGMELRR